MHVCWGACTWSGLQASRGGAGASRVGSVKGWCLGVPCEAWVLQDGARGILADDRLGSGSKAEMGWLPWNLQSACLDQSQGRCLWLHG